MSLNSVEDGGTSRRTVLLGAGGVGAVTLLAACGSNGGSAGPAGGNGAPAAQTGSAGTDLGPVSDIPVGGGKIFPDQLTVVTQPTAGDLKAFTAVCTHMRCTVSSVSGGTINCPCHGSRYSITDGSVVNGPAPQPLASKPITVANNQIHLA